MNTKQIISLLLLLIILVSGCSENIVSPTEDEMLSSQIIGKWEAKNYEILILKDDGSFIDTSLATFSDNPTKYVPHYIIEGKYYVREEVLFFYDISLLYAKAEESALAFGAPLDPRKIIIDNNNLSLQLIKIFDPKENNYPNLTGKWESSSWVGVFDKNIQPNYKGGEQMQIFDFNSDSLKLNYSIKYMFDTELVEYETKTNYDFDGNVLKYQNYPEYNVQFKNNKMYWSYYIINYTK
jgi:hypothetical protein